MSFNFKYIKVSSILFFLFFILGFIGIYFFSRSMGFNENGNEELIRNNITFSKVFFNNLIVCTIAIFGILTFRISSGVVLIFNSLYLGIVIGANYSTTGQLWYFMKFLIPHGIFEIPAIILACSIGFEGLKFFKKYTLRQKLYNIILIICLLTIAAFIEVNISNTL